MGIDPHIATGFLFQTLLGLTDFRQTLVTAFQFVGQFVAATAAERGILLRVELLRLLQQLLDLRFQPLDVFVHVAVAHRLVARGISAHFRAIGRQIAELDENP